jgi:hypothetical protein
MLTSCAPVISAEKGFDESLSSVADITNSVFEPPNAIFATESTVAY